MSMRRVRLRALRSLPILALASAFVGASCGGQTFTSSGAGAGAGSGAGAVSGLGNAGAAGHSAGGASPGGGSAGASFAGESSEAGASSGGSAEGGASSGGAAAAGAPSGGNAGSVGSAGNAAGGSAAGSGGGGPPLEAACPTDPPGSEGCIDGLSCTYGDDLRSRCRSQYKCMNAKWAAMLVTCPVLIACIDRTAGFPKSGDPCPTVGEDCTLDNGPYGKVYCRCDACAAGSCTRSWECAGPPTGCPLVVPNEGQPCDTNGTSCQYGNCSMTNALQVQCTKKTWRWLPVACPKM